MNFSYKGYCSDTVANDWQEVQIQNTSGVVLAQVMKVCSNAQTWTRVYFNLLPYGGFDFRGVAHIFLPLGNLGLFATAFAFATGYWPLARGTHDVPLSGTT